MAVLFMVALACRTSEPAPETQKRYKSYHIAYKEANQREVYRGTFQYDQFGRLQSEVQNDTTYKLGSGQIVPVRTTIVYEYNSDGFMIKKTRSAVSIQLTATAVTDYEYNSKGLLAREVSASSVREYQYDETNQLKTTIQIALSTGNKNVIEYKGDIPLTLLKNENGSGYVLKQTDEITYINDNLLVTRYERYRDNLPIFEQDYEYQDGNVPESRLPVFKGFPRIKHFDYSKGILKNIVTYQYPQGSKVLSDEKRLVPNLDAEGDLIKSVGYERINQETSNSEYRDLLFEYFYEEI